MIHRSARAGTQRIVSDRRMRSLNTIVKHAACANLLVHNWPRIHLTSYHCCSGTSLVILAACRCNGWSPSSLWSRSAPSWVRSDRGPLVHVPADELLRLQNNKHRVSAAVQPVVMAAGQGERQPNSAMGVHWGSQRKAHFPYSKPVLMAEPGGSMESGLEVEHRRASITPPVDVDASSTASTAASVTGAAVGAGGRRLQVSGSALDDLLNFFRSILGRPPVTTPPPSTGPVQPPAPAPSQPPAGPGGQPTPRPPAAPAPTGPSVPETFPFLRFPTPATFQEGNVIQNKNQTTTIVDYGLFFFQYLR